MRRPKMDWEKIRQECVDFDLSEFRPEMRQEPGFYGWNKDDPKPVREVEAEDFYFFGDPF